MSPDLPETLLGMHTDDGDDRRSSGRGDGEETELERFVYFSIGEHQLAVPVDDVKTITKLSDSPTRVPRAPEAIEGVIDIRGEVTVVVEPRVHFPVEQDPLPERDLVVFNRPSDEQQAGILVDELAGVETIPVDNVLEDPSGEERDAAGGAIAHPLVSALLKRERSPTVELGGPIGSDTDSAEDAGKSSLSAGSPLGTSLTAARDRTAFESDTFDLGEDGTDSQQSTEEPDTTEQTPVELEFTGLVDDDKLLLASGYRSDRGD